MNIIDHKKAFNSLQETLCGNIRADSWSCNIQAFDRLRESLVSENTTTNVEKAVLLRQALVFENIKRYSDNNIGIYIGKNFLFDFQYWSDFGLQCFNQKDDERKLMVKKWAPDWLKSERSVDQHASSEKVMNQEDGTEKSSDSFLSVVNREFYKSERQRDVVRAVLSTAPGETLVAMLATGEGKSLIFQLIHMIGFLGDTDFSKNGLTVIIVPTVALAINHEQEAKKLCSIDHPLAYQGGSETSNALIFEKIKDGSQGILFAAPEAVCGPLRTVILEAAKMEKLKSIVIDEAHIIDQWGTDFRTPFQELSFFIQQLKSLAGVGRELRTIMLSATLSKASLETLNVLFSIEKNLPIVASVRLRKEPEYWVSSKVSDDERKVRVLEAIRHIPRPAILYVTTKQDVRFWFRHLKEYGFNNLEMMDGDTTTNEREEIVTKWKSGKLDLIVATSAFGLGIDYQNARSVIHACIPENLDRFYQEVGRGGRDGKSSLSLLIPSFSDVDIARNLNAKKVISLERGLERWTTMFKKKENIENKIFIRLDVAPGTSEKDIDMVGPSNTGWNMRTLLLMARSQILKIEGYPLKKIKDTGQWVEISELHEDHLSGELWKEKIEPVREKILMETKKQLDLMNDYLVEKKCVSELLESLYEINKSKLKCGLCGYCRKNNHTKIPAKSPDSFKFNIQPKFNEFITKSLLDSKGKLNIKYRNFEFSRRENRRFRDCLIKLQGFGLGKLILIGEEFPFDDKCLDFTKNTVFFTESCRNSSSLFVNLPPGVEMAFYGFNQIINKCDIEYEQSKANPRIFVFPEDQVYDGRRLIDVVDGRLWSLDKLINKVGL